MSLGLWALVAGVRGAESEAREPVLDAFTGQWEGEVEIRAMDGALLKTFPIVRRYEWDDSLQIVETVLTDGEERYEVRTFQSAQGDRLHARVDRPFETSHDYSGTVEGGGVEWENESRNNRDFTEKISIVRGRPRLTVSSVEPLRFSGITGVVQWNATLRPTSGRWHAGFESGSEVAALTARIEELEAQLAAAESASVTRSTNAPPMSAEALRAAEQEAASLDVRVRELERERDELRAKLAETAMLNWTTAALRQARDEADRETEQLRRNLEEAGRRSAEARQQAETAERELRAIEDAIAAAKSANDTTLSAAEFRRQLESAMAARDQARARASEQADRIEMLTRELQAKQDEAVEAAARIAQLEEQLERQSSAVADDRAAARQMEALETRVADEQRRRTSAEADFAELATELAAVRDELKEHEARNTELTAANAQLESAAEQARTDLADERAHMEQLDEELRSAVTRADELETQVAATREARDSAQSVLEEQRQNTADLTRRVAELERTVNVVTTERDALAGELTTVQAEKSRLDDRIKPLETAARSTRELRREMESSSAELREQADGLRDQVSQLSAQLEASNQRLATVTAERDDLQHSLGDAQAELQRLGTQARETQSTELAQARDQARALEETVQQLESQLERLTTEKDAAMRQAAELESAQNEIATLRQELEREQADAAQRQTDNENLVARNERLEQEKAEMAARLAAAEEADSRAPAPRGIAAEGTANQELFTRMETLDRRVLELESERNALQANTAWLEKQLEEAQALRDETLARFQTVVSQLNAMREDRDRLARANVSLESELRLAKREPRTLVQADESAPAESEPGVFRRLLSAVSGSEVPRTPDTVIASFEILGITQGDDGDKVILNGRLYRNGETVDSELGLVFERIDGDALVFSDRRGREYRRRF